MTRPRPEAPVQRVAAYAVVRDERGRVLLTRNSARSEFPGLWSLPGGGVEHGEHPAEAAIREVREEAGLDVRLTGLPRVYADVLPLPARDVLEHTVRLVYDAEVTAGTVRAETDGTSDLAEFADPAGHLDAAGGGDHPVLPFVAAALGLPEPPAPSARDAAPRAVAEPEVRAEGILRRQRLAAYGLARHDDRILVTQLSASTPRPAAWTLPGGGVDHGEHPEAALVREFAEETGLAAEVGELVGVYSVRFTGQAPNGVLEDFHGIRLVYATDVDTTRPPRVVEVAGTTAAVAWRTPDELAELPTTVLLREATGA